MGNWDNASSTLIGPDGKPVISLQFSACPICGRAYSERIPSAGFGADIFMMCPCGYEFEKRFKCPKPIL